MDVSKLEDKDKNRELLKDAYADIKLLVGDKTLSDVDVMEAANHPLPVVFTYTEITTSDLRTVLNFMYRLNHELS